MSTSISDLSDTAADYSTDAKNTSPRPTVMKQMETLAASGTSAQHIAEDLGVTTSQVATALDIPTTATTKASQVATVERFSAHA